jgi:hypothetical protein
MYIFYSIKNGLEMLAAAKHYLSSALFILIGPREAISCTKKIRIFAGRSLRSSDSPVGFSGARICLC